MYGGQSGFLLWSAVPRWHPADGAPGGPYSQQQQTQSDSICFTAIFVNNAALCYSPYCMLYIVYKLQNEFSMPKALALLCTCILYSNLYYIIFSFDTTKTIFSN